MTPWPVVKDSIAENYVNGLPRIEVFERYSSQVFFDELIWARSDASYQRMPPGSAVEAVEV